ncbi:MAG TPA: NADH-quinone oxidoreductase subunit K [Elusimicrobiales bacterium]|nr:NADH-quinone oxidoreductase subunit K [Elusimicrobiales bacterium]
MSDLVLKNLLLNWYFVALLAFVGLYCLVVSRNMLRLLIGIEILAKATLLALMASGQALGNINLAQTFAITMIAVEVVVVAVALALFIKYYAVSGSLDIWKMNKLKG